MVAPQESLDRAMNAQPVSEGVTTADTEGLIGSRKSRKLFLRAVAASVATLGRGGILLSEITSSARMRS